MFFWLDDPSVLLRHDTRDFDPATEDERDDEEQRDGQPGTR